MPERFVLDKNDIKFVLNNVEKFWNRSEMNTIQNASYITQMAMVKGSIAITDLVTLKNIWFSLLETIRQLQTLNALKISVQDAEDEPQRKSFQALVDIQRSKIESGKAFEG